ncbi:unnamed protein product, partial [Prorocentrum cordatum]
VARLQLTVEQVVEKMGTDPQPLEIQKLMRCMVEDASVTHMRELQRKDGMIPDAADESDDEDAADSQPKSNAKLEKDLQEKSFWEKIKNQGFAVGEKWAEYQHVTVKKVSERKRLLKKAAYMPLGRVAHKEGGGQAGWAQAVKYFSKCVRMGYPWIKWHSMTEVHRCLYGTESIEEEFEQAWETHEKGYGKMIRASTAEGQPSSAAGDEDTPPYEAIGVASSAAGQPGSAAAAAVQQQQQKQQCSPANAAMIMTDKSRENEEILAGADQQKAEEAAALRPAEQAEARAGEGAQAKRKAEAQPKRKAEDEAKRKAEEEAKRKAEEGTAGRKRRGGGAGSQAAGSGGGGGGGDAAATDICDDVKSIMKEARMNVLLYSSVISTGQTIQNAVTADPSWSFARGIKEVQEVRK